VGREREKSKEQRALRCLNNIQQMWCETRGEDEIEALRGTGGFFAYLSGVIPRGQPLKNLSKGLTRPYHWDPKLQTQVHT